MVWLFSSLSLGARGYLGGDRCVCGKLRVHLCCVILRVFECGLFFLR